MGEKIKEIAKIIVETLEKDFCGSELECEIREDKDAYIITIEGDANEREYNKFAELYEILKKHFEHEDDFGDYSYVVRSYSVSYSIVSEEIGYDEDTEEWTSKYHIDICISIEKNKVDEIYKDLIKFAFNEAIN